MPVRLSVSQFINSIISTIKNSFSLTDVENEGNTFISTYLDFSITSECGLLISIREEYKKDFIEILQKIEEILQNKLDQA